MSSNKSSSKSKQRRASCLFFCFNGSVVVEPGQLETAPGAATDGAKHRCSWFSWSRFRKKKRSSPVAKSISVLSNTATQLEAKEKIKRSQSMPQSPPKRQKSTIVDDQVSAIPRHPHLPHLTSKYSARTRPEPPSYRSEPVHNRLKHGRSGSSSSEPSQPQTAASRAASGDRSGQPRKLDTKAGLAVLGVTLGVMVIYGRVAAVVCLCALLYIAALLLQPTLDEEVVEKRVAGEADMTSKDYRKRVVLEGLLERVGRRPHALGNAIELKTSDRKVLFAK